MAPTVAGHRQREFEQLYASHLEDVYRFALSLVRDPVAAEDITQTTFLNAFCALESGDRPRAPRSWLLAIAHNAARSRARRATRRPREVSLDEAADAAARDERERPSLAELVRAVRRLPANQRAAVTMRELEGRSYPEIACTLGVTVEAVEALLSRARRTLRSHAAAIRGLAGVGLPQALRGLLAAGSATLAVGVAVGAGGADRHPGWHAAPVAGSARPVAAVAAPAARPIPPAAQRPRTAPGRFAARHAAVVEPSARVAARPPSAPPMSASASATAAPGTPDGAGLEPDAAAAPVAQLAGAVETAAEPVVAAVASLPPPPAISLDPAVPLPTPPPTPPAGPEPVQDAVSQLLP